MTGGAASDFLGLHNITSGDLNGNGKLDLVVGGYGVDNNSRSASGSLYVLYDSILDDYTSTGNTIDLADTTKYNSRYDGPIANGEFSYGTTMVIDFNSDGSLDLLTGVYLGDYNSRTDSGSFYIIYNFPHTISLDPFTAKSWDTFSVTGIIAAPNSTTYIDGVEYQIDGNSPTLGWIPCAPNDGNFDGLTENFTCSLPKLTEKQHTLYIRAYDTNGSYTAQSSYSTSSLDLRPGLSGSSSSQSIPSFATKYEGYVFTAENIRVVLEKDSISFDNTLSVSLQNAPKTLCGLRPVSPIYSLWLTDIHNGARVLPQLHKKPSLLAISGSAFVSKNLKIAYTNASDPLKTCSWRILPTSVMDPINHTVAALHKIGGYYMVVSRGSGETFLNMSAVRGVSSPEPEDVPLSVGYHNSVVPKSSLISTPGVETSVRSGEEYIEKRSNMQIFFDFVKGSLSNLFH